MTRQLNLLDREEPVFDPRFSTLKRSVLAHGAWVDYAQGWLRGHAPLFETLLSTVAWQSGEQQMYDRSVITPRLFAVLPRGEALHPLLERMRGELSRRYQHEFARVSLALYRDGRDSVAFHGDRVARELPNALVATVSVGAPRKFLLRPKLADDAAGVRRSLAYQLGWGDLLVMGGSCQRTWQHAIPKVAHAEPRIAIMFRPVW